MATSRSGRIDPRLSELAASRDAAWDKYLLARRAAEEAARAHRVDMDRLEDRFTLDRLSTYVKSWIVQFSASVDLSFAFVDHCRLTTEFDDYAAASSMPEGEDIDA